VTRKKTLPSPQSLPEAVEVGERRAILEAQRRRLAALLQFADPGPAASLSKELRAVSAELDAMADPEQSVSDDLAERRARRVAGLAGS
jgi:hypothetical protein